MRPISQRKALLVLFTMSCGAVAAQAAEEPSTLGRRINGFSLADYRGKTHALADYAGKPAVVLYFLGTECPLTKLYGPRIQSLSERFGPQGVAFVGISSNVQDSVTELSAHARIHGITFPILKDLGNKLADELGATRTPQVFVLDKDRMVRYCGRVDAQFTFGSGVGLSQPVVQREDLAIALEELLAGRPVSVAETEAKGCLIGRVAQPKPDSPVTYSNQIARLFQRRCIECHRAGQIAPFTLTDYDDAAGWGEMIAEVVRQQRMPPWHANPAYGHFSNENRLSDAEKQLVATWVKNGCPEGDPAELPAPRTFQEGWFMPRPPDKVVFMSAEPATIKAEGVEPYRHFTVDPGFTEDKWVKLAEAQPGNKAVVHHIIVFIKPPGEADEDDKKPRQNNRGGEDGRLRNLLAGFAPGTRPLITPRGWAQKIPAGAKLVFQMHYTPIGSVQQDCSRVGLIFVDEKEVTHEVQSGTIPYQDLEIPPHEANYRVVANKKFPRDTVMLSMFPHMHMRGKAFRYELIAPGSEASPEILLDVPSYDFNWQNSYILAEPRLIPAGSVVRCTARFDNSEDNLANPDPTKTVKWGPQTWEEMMIGWYEMGIPRAQAESSRAAGGQSGQ